MSPNAIVSPSVMYRITLFAGSNDKVIQHITDGLTTAFGDIKPEAGPRLSYLNVLIDTSNPQELTRYKTLFLRVYIDPLLQYIRTAIILYSIRWFRVVAAVALREGRAVPL